jgi:hypothetical protein
MARINPRARRFKKQPQGTFPRLKKAFRDAVVVYLPSVAQKHAATQNITVGAGSAPTLVNKFGARLVQFTNPDYLSIANTQTLDFSGTGFTVLAVGAYAGTTGVQPIEVLVARTGGASAAGGFDIALYNAFGGTPANVWSSYTKPGTGDTAYDTFWVNGVKATTGNGDPATAVNTRYACAGAATSGPDGGAASSINIGRGTGSSDTDAMVEMVIIWPRRFSEQTLRQITADPYSIFESLPVIVGQEPAVTFVPVGTMSPIQSQIAYREPSRLIQSTPPKSTAGTTAVYIAKAAMAAQLMAAAPWPYAQVQQPEFAPIAAVAAMPAPIKPAVPVQASWPYAQVLTQPDYSPGIVPPYIGASKTVVPVQAAWPYANLINAPEVLPTPPAQQVAPNTVSLPLQASWPYAAVQDFTVFSSGITPQYVFSLPVIPVPPTPWPYSATLNPAPTASEFGQSGFNPPNPVLIPVPPTPWPYAASFLPAPSASEWRQSTAYAGVVPVVQWLTYPAWPYAATFVPSPTASEWGQAPPPIPVNVGSNALRRWVIQQYEQYFEQRDLQAKVSKAMAKKAKAHKPRPTAPVFKHADQDGDYLTAAFRLANQISAGAIDINARVVRLEGAKALPPLKSIIPPAQAISEQHARDDEDMMLLAILFNEGV